MTKASKRLILLLTTAFLIKTSLVFMVIPKLSESYLGGYRIGHFPDEYAHIAVNLLEGNGYRVYTDTAQTFIRPPGYIFVLVVLFSIFGKNLAAAQLLNIFFTLIAAVILYIISKKVIKNSKAALFATILYLFHPGTILSETRGGTEVFFTLLLCVYILILYQAIETNEYKYYFLSGIIIGIASLVKSTPVLFPLFLLFLLIYMKRKEIQIKFIVTRITLMIFGLLIALSPWIIRNYRVSGEFIPTMTLSGIAAQEGLYTGERWGTDKHHWQLRSEAKEQRIAFANELNFPFKGKWTPYFYSSKNEILFNQALMSKVKQEYVNHPYLFFKTVIHNFFYFWFQSGTAFAVIVNFLFTLPLLLLITIGIFLGIRHNLNVLPIIAFFIYFIIVHLPLQGLARYHVPLIPCMCVLATIAFFHKYYKSYEI